MAEVVGTWLGWWGHSWGGGRGLIGVSGATPEVVVEAFLRWWVVIAGGGGAIHQVVVGK